MSTCYLKLTSSALGTEVQDRINDHIVRKYLGEQPVGSAFIVKNSGNNLKYRYIIVVALFRAITCRGDDMAWLDPCYIPMDYAYSAMRGVMLRLFQHNAVSQHNKIKTIYCPDFFKVFLVIDSAHKLDCQRSSYTRTSICRGCRACREVDGLSL